MHIPEHEILDKLLSDQKLGLIDKGEFLRYGTCPDCRKKTVWVGKHALWHIRCDRESKCGYTETIKERYPELFSNWKERYPVTTINPNATAQAYMEYKRGLSQAGFKGLYKQGKFKLKNGKFAETVQFEICPGITWHRLIEDDDIAADESGKTRIIKAKKTASYKGQYWSPGFQSFSNNSVVFIVESIFCALSLHSANENAVSCISSNNIPHQLIKDHGGKGITWNVSYDNDAAGYKRIKQCVDAFKKSGEKVEVYLNEEGKDWNDAYIAKKIDSNYLEECMWRGYIFMAPSAKERAFARFAFKHRKVKVREDQEINTKTYSGRDVFAFDGVLYSSEFSPETFIRESSGTALEYPDSREPFSRSTIVIPVSNCTIDFCYVEKDLFTEERLYAFKVKKRDEKRPTICRLSSASINDAKALSTAILGTTNGANINLSTADLRILHRRWLDGKTIMIEALQFIGFDETTRSYVFPTFGYKNGRKYSSQVDGYIQLNDKALRTNLKGVTICDNDSYDGGKWINDFIKVFHYNGIAALGFFTASLFARQIKEAQQKFTFFELTGEPGAGKSTLIRFLWKLFGRQNFEGVDLQSLSESAYGRHLSKLSNLPFVVMESDCDGGEGKKSKSVDWDRFKKVFDLDGVVDGRGVKTNDNQTSERIFRGTLMISQNASVQASQAMMERIVHMHCTKEHKKVENRDIANGFETAAAKDFCGYMHNALKNEKLFLNTFFSCYAEHRQALLNVGQFIDDRVIDCHAQIMAAVSGLTTLIDGFTEDRCQKVSNYLIQRAIIRQGRLGCDNPIIQEFWETYHYINDEYAFVSDENGERHVNRRLLNHSKKTSYIAINLNHYIELCRAKGQRLPELAQLKDLLPTSKRYAFIGTKKVRSRLSNDALVRCWVFSNTENEGVENV